MSGKSIDYWREAWNNVLEYFYEDEHAEKVLGLLSLYASFFRYIPFPGVGNIGLGCGGTVGRFFSGRWNTHHGDAVQNAIGDFYAISGMGNSSKYHSVEFILAAVKRAVGQEPIKKDGDLARILEVIREKTGVDYFELDANSVYERYENPNYSKYNTFSRR